MLRACYRHAANALTVHPRVQMLILTSALLQTGTNLVADVFTCEQMTGTNPEMEQQMEQERLAILEHPVVFPPGKSTDRVQLHLHARVWTKTQLHRHARVWTKTQGCGRKLVSIQTVAPALPAADCVHRIYQRIQGVGWLCGIHWLTCLGLDCHEFRMRLQLHTLCAIHTAITFPPLVSCAATLTVVAPRHRAVAPHRAVMGIKRRPVERPVEHACAEAPHAPRN